MLRGLAPDGGLYMPVEIARRSPEELEEFEEARKEFGQEAEDFIGQCYSMHEAFALSLRPAKSSDALKDRLMSMVRNRQKS